MMHYDPHLHPSPLPSTDLNMLMIIIVMLIGILTPSNVMSIKKELNRKLSSEVDINFEGYNRDKTLSQKISSWRASHADEYFNFRQILRTQQRNAKRMGLESVVDKESKITGWPQHRLRSKRKKSRLRKIRSLQSL